MLTKAHLPIQLLGACGYNSTIANSTEVWRRLYLCINTQQSAFMALLMHLLTSLSILILSFLGLFPMAFLLASLFPSPFAFPTTQLWCLALAASATTITFWVTATATATATELVDFCRHSVWVNFQVFSSKIVRQVIFALPCKMS